MNKHEKDGLFVKEFLAHKSGICARGNYEVIGDEKEKLNFCEQRGVEFVIGDSPGMKISNEIHQTNTLTQAFEKEILKCEYSPLRKIKEK